MMRIANVFAAVLLALPLALTAGCMRDDPAPAAVDSQSRQQLDLLQRQLEAISTELRGAASGGSRAGEEPADWIARLAVLENRAVRDREFLELQAEVRKLAEQVEQLASQLAEQRGTLDDAAAIRARYDGLAARLQDGSHAQEALAEQVRAQAQRISTLEAQVLDKMTAYLEAVERGGAADPRQQERMAELEQALQTALDEQARLQEQLATRNRQLDQSRTTGETLSRRIDVLEARLRSLGVDPRNSEEPTVSTRSEGGEQVPEAVREGAYTGRIRVVRLDTNICVASFPVGTPRTIDQRFNVFDESGQKVANFIVLHDSTPPELEGQEVWLGGTIERVPNRRQPERDDRVSNLSSLPRQTQPRSPLDADTAAE